MQRGCGGNVRYEGAADGGTKTSAVVCCCGGLSGIGTLRTKEVQSRQLGRTEGVSFE